MFNFTDWTNDYSILAFDFTINHHYFVLNSADKSNNNEPQTKVRKSFRIL